MCLVGVVVRRYIDFFILLILSLLLLYLFCSSIPTFCSFFHTPLVSFLQQHPYFLFIFSYSSCIFFAAASLLFVHFFIFVNVFRSCSSTFCNLFNNFSRSINKHKVTTGIPRKPYEGLHIIHEESHTNVCFISCDGPSAV